MAEDNGQYNFQISGKVHGDLVVVRGNTAEEFSANLAALATYSGDVVTNWSDFKELAVAKGIFTGDATGGPSNGGQRKARRGDDPPPSGDTPSCAHGTMNDFKERGYKHRYYCPEKNRANQCPARD